MDNHSSDFVLNYRFGPCIRCKRKPECQPDNYVECKDCHLLCHITCIKGNLPRRKLVGDNYFSYQCTKCNSQKKEVVNLVKMPMKYILLISLYNLHLLNPKDSKRGMFHYRKHIHKFIKEYFDVFSFGWKENEGVPSPNVVCDFLSKSDYFVSKKFGNENNEVGRWYALASIVPPSVAIYEKERPEIKTNNPAGEEELCNKDKAETNIVAEKAVLEFMSDSFGIDVLDFDEKILESIEPIPYHLMDCFAGGNSDVEVLSESALSALPKSPLLSTQPTRSSEEQEQLQNVPSKKQKLNQSDKKEEVLYPDLKVKSYFTHSAPLKSTTPKKKVLLKEGEMIVPMTVYDERVKLNKLNSKLTNYSLSQAEYLLRRKLVVRQTKREFGLPVFNVDEEAAFLDKHGRMMTNEERLAATYCNENAQWAGGPPSVLDRYQISGQDLFEMKTKRSITFKERLTGAGDDDFDFIDSPYTGKSLKPFIWRNYKGTSQKLKLHQELVEYVRKKNGDLYFMAPCFKPIDYRYVTPNHIPALNHLAKTYFWDGIDLSEILQYPDFTCIASYGKLVIGFGVIVPDTRPNEGYISFLLVHPEWRRSGIGNFILYHLIQTCQGKDITLHVSSTNPAMFMYQKFGFKVEEYLPNFYEKYLPFEDPQCKHAMFLRLHR